MPATKSMKKRPRGDGVPIVPVCIDEDVYLQIKVITAARRIKLGRYVTESLRRQVERDYRAVMDELTR